jgi:GH15 family glucan-1,4-alpha-glucosidase
VFAALLDREKGGRFSVGPSASLVHVTREYTPGTNVLETRMRTPTGEVGLTDCMPILDGTGPSRSLSPQRELLRVVEGLSGEVELEVIFQPRPNFARAPVRLRRRGRNVWCDVLGARQFLLHAEAPLTESGDATQQLTGRFRLRAGERRVFSLSYAERDIAIIPPLGQEAYDRLAATRRWWRGWSGRCRYQGPYREQVLRSLLTLKLMTFHLSGAVVAAPTASLPERIGGVRNWDYRFCWLRDAALTFRVFSDLGYNAEAAAFLGWMLHATRLTWPELQVMYDVYGETRLPERQLDHLDGYRGSRPVRVGNAASRQLQLDIYGAVVVAAFNFAMDGGRLDRGEGRMLVGLGRSVCRLWRRPDQGIWEMRDAGRHHTYSKLMCWVALDRLLRLHDAGNLSARLPERRFRIERAAIARAIEERGFQRHAGSYVGAFGRDYVDASLLLLARYGFKSADDPRMLGTWDRVQRELQQDGMIYRHREGLDGLPPGEGAFVICSFWAVDYLARLGRVDEATRRFEDLLGLANDLGLLAEEADPANRMALGNFPQAYSHVGLVTAALALEEARVRGRSSA